MALYGYGVEPIQDPIAVGGSSAPTGYNLIEQNGTPLTQRTTLNVLPRLLAQDDGVSATTLDLAQVGTAGTYTSVTTDAYGRVTAGTNPGFLTSVTLKQAYDFGGAGGGTVALTTTGGALSLTATALAGGANVFDAAGILDVYKSSAQGGDFGGTAALTTVTGI